MNPETTRLNKHLALQLGISRREADDYISAGRVTVDSTIAVLGARTTKDSAITVDKKPLITHQAFQYIALNKPTGYVCSRKRQGDTPTIYELLPNELSQLKAVGRLDKDSSGLILLTNDGTFAHQMTHPSFHKTKSYEVALAKALEPLHQQMISDHGIALEDGPSKLQLEKITDDRTSWRVTMHEGRNRQIRRTFAALGYDIVKLHRTQCGQYELGALASGMFKEFSP
jgi:23S rRNA pseudouridine2605 synthase